MDAIRIAIVKDTSLLSISNINEKDFFGNPIVYRTKDKWGDIMVIDKKNCRILAFDPIYEQSRIDLKNPHIPVHEYTRIMLLVLTFMTPDHVTILGLGGGSLLHTLHYLLPHCALLSIELRQKVYETAVNFFLIPVKHNIEINISDAKRAMARCGSRSTQIIFADMYQSCGMDPFQMQKKFIQQCYRVLDDTGWLVINYHQLPLLDSIFVQCLQQYFTEIYVCPGLGGNYILFARKSPEGAINRNETSVFNLDNLEKKLNIQLSHLFKRMTQIYKKNS